VTRPDLTGIGARIKARREELGLSKIATARGTSISFSYLGKVEKGIRQPSLSVVIELADRLETTALQLAFGSRPEQCPFCGSQLEPRSAR
jgi:transcriptional regulator with XRE-family HTH domain